MIGILDEVICTAPHDKSPSHSRYDTGCIAVNLGLDLHIPCKSACLACSLFASNWSSDPKFSSQLKFFNRNLKARVLNLALCFLFRRRFRVCRTYSGAVSATATSLFGRAPIPRAAAGLVT